MTIIRRLLKSISRDKDSLIISSVMAVFFVIVAFTLTETISSQPAAEVTEAEAQEEEEDNDGAEASPAAGLRVSRPQSQLKDSAAADDEDFEFEPGPEILNMAYYYSEDADVSDAIHSYAGETFEYLNSRNADLYASFYDLTDKTPLTVASELGLSRSRVLGGYNPSDSAHDPTNSDTWTVNSFKNVDVTFLNGDGARISGYYAAQEIMSLASVYMYYHDDYDPEHFRDYCSSLFDSAFSYKITLGSVYKCSGGCLNKTKAQEASEALALEAELLADSIGVDIDVYKSQAALAISETAEETSPDEYSQSERAPETADTSEPSYVIISPTDESGTVGVYIPAALMTTEDETGETGGESLSTESEEALVNPETPAAEESEASMPEESSKDADLGLFRLMSFDERTLSAEGEISGIVDFIEAEPIDPEAVQTRGLESSEAMAESTEAQVPESIYEESIEASAEEGAKAQESETYTESTEPESSEPSYAIVSGVNGSDHVSYSETVHESETPSSIIYDSQYVARYYFDEEGNAVDTWETLENTPEESGETAEEGVLGEGESAPEESTEAAGEVSEQSVIERIEELLRQANIQEQSDAYCPGHIDIYVTVTIRGINDSNGLFKCDTIGNDSANFTDRWQGWTDDMIEEARALASQDWFEEYGLSISSITLYSSLSADEISAYIASLPSDTEEIRRQIVEFALNSVGKVPYYWGGKPSGPGYESNNFNVLTSPDTRGRILKGLDCSGWVNWIYWSVTGYSLAGQSTGTLVGCGSKISRADLKAGDIVIRLGEDAHVVMFLSWAGDGDFYAIHETGGVINNVTVSKMTANWPYYRSLV